MTAIATAKVLLIVAPCMGVALPTWAACPQQTVKVTPQRLTQPTHFAVAGLIDINGDGKSDLATLRRLIALNGGVIDAEIHVGEESKGQLQRGTAYVIVGELPDKASVAPKVARQFDAFLRRASQLRIRVIQFGDLLKMGSRLPKTQRGKEPFTRRRPVIWPPSDPIQQTASTRL